MEIRDIPLYRERKRRDGTIYFTSNNELGFGPFTWEARQMILEKLLLTQREMSYELITEDELRAIDRIWDEEKDISRRTLVDLYHRVMGSQLPWDHLKYSLFDSETIEKLSIYAEQYKVPMDLLKTMIFTTNKNKFFSNTRLLRDALSKSVSQQWLQEESLCGEGEETQDAN